MILSMGTTTNVPMSNAAIKMNGAWCLIWFQLVFIEFNVVWFIK